MSDDIALGDLVTAFRLEFRDGLMRIDQLGQTLAQFEGAAKARLQGVGDAGEHEGSRLAQGLSNGLTQAGQRLATFVMGLIGVGGILEGLRRLGDAFITANDQVDTFVNRIAAFTGGLGQARQEEQRLEDFATKMGAKVGDLVDAYVLLKQRGIDPTNTSLEALGNAAAATNTSIANVAQVMAQATLDMGRGLMNFGVKMTETAGRAKFEWVNAAGEAKTATVLATDKMIQSTLVAIWNDKYPGRMAEAAKSWQGLWASIKNSFDNLLTGIGGEGVWTEVKSQLAGILGEFQALKGQDLKTWAKATSDALDPLIKALGALGSALIEVPLAAQVLGDFVGRTFANILTFMEKVGLLALQTGKAMLSIMPTQKGQMEALDQAIVTMKGAIADTTFAANDLDKQMTQNGLTLHRLQQAGIDAATGYREAAKGAQEMGPFMDEATRKLVAMNAEFEDERTKILDLYGVYDTAKLNEKMAEVTDAFTKMVDHGVPANEILAALGPTVNKLATTAADFGPGFQLPDDFKRLAEAVGGGKVSMDDFVRYLDDKAWKALKTGADDTVVSITKAGGGIAEALRGGFGKGIDDAISTGKTKFQEFVTQVGQQRITINVDINKADLIATLMSLGYTPVGMDNTAGRTRAS